MKEFQGLPLTAREHAGGREAAGRPTPNLSDDLAMKLGGFSTLTEGLDYAAQGTTGFNFYSGRGALEHVLTYGELRQRALAVARKLITQGLKRLDRVAVVA